MIIFDDFPRSINDVDVLNEIKRISKNAAIVYFEGLNSNLYSFQTLKDVFNLSKINFLLNLLCLFIQFLLFAENRMQIYHTHQYRIS